MVIGGSPGIEIKIKSITIIVSDRGINDFSIACVVLVLSGREKWPEELVRSTEIFELDSISKIFVIILPTDISDGKFNLKRSGCTFVWITFEAENAEDNMLVKITQSSCHG